MFEPWPQLPRVVLACSSCEHVYEPTEADFDGAETGCPLCGGWTFIAELAEPGEPR
jgi:Zn finger protein HypA/HybF involved in hydrogenase expression